MLVIAIVWIFMSYWAVRSIIHLFVQIEQEMIKVYFPDWRSGTSSQDDWTKINRVIKTLIDNT